MMETGVNTANASHTFFSHLHYDHCVDYARLLMTHWDQSDRRLPELKVCGPPHTARMTELYIGEDGLFGPNLEARCNQQFSIDTFE